MRRLVGPLTSTVAVLLAACGGDGTLPFASPTTDPPAVATAEATTTEPSDSTDSSASSEPRSSAGSTGSSGSTGSAGSAGSAAPSTDGAATSPTGAASTTSVGATTTTVGAATTTSAGATTTAVGATTTTAAGATTTVAFTSPVGPTTSTSVLSPNDPPAVFVDVGATGVASGGAAGGAAPPIEEVVTELRPGAMVLPAGARVLDIEIRVLPSADANQSGASARNDRIRSIVGTDLALEQLTARFREALEGLGAYEPSETPLPAPQFGVTISAPAPAGDRTLPAWTITIVADAAQSSRWVIDVQRQDPSFAAPPTEIPPTVATPLAAASGVLDALEWTVDGWSYRRLVDDADGAELVARRLLFVSGTTDINEVAGALVMSLPEAQRTDLDGTVEILAADGTRWDIGGTNANGLVRGAVQLDR